MRTDFFWKFEIKKPLQIRFFFNFSKTIRNFTLVYSEDLKVFKRRIFHKKENWKKPNGFRVKRFPFIFVFLEYLKTSKT